MRVLIVEDEPYLAEAIRDGLRLEAIAADIAGDGDTALELLSINAYDITVLDRDIPGPCGCRKPRSSHAAWAYSWMSPPSRSSRTTRSLAAGSGSGTAPSGGA
jgi:DNA-binding response OmpR family regulator